MANKKKFDLEAYKETIKVADTPLKKESYLELHPCLHEIIGMPGLPMGHITQVYGKSDSGKTSLMFHAAAQAQQQNILPIIIITEGKVDWDRAAAMGFDPDNAIIINELDYIEQVFAFMQNRTSDVMSGELPIDVMFFWDSVGNTLSENEIEVDKKTGYVTKKKGMQVAARAMSEGMRPFSKLLNNTRKISSKYSAGAFFINTGYNKPPTFPGGPTTYVPYGGEKLYFNSSLILKTHRKGKLEATKDKKKLVFGLKTKISVEKNHINGVSLSGDFAIATDEIMNFEATAIKDYKERNKEKWGDLIVKLIKEEDSTETVADEN